MLGKLKYFLIYFFDFTKHSNYWTWNSHKNLIIFNKFKSYININININIVHQTSLFVQYQWQNKVSSVQWADDSSIYLVQAAPSSPHRRLCFKVLIQNIVDVCSFLFTLGYGQSYIDNIVHFKHIFTLI